MRLKEYKEFGIKYFSSFELKGIIFNEKGKQYSKTFR